MINNLSIFNQNVSGFDILTSFYSSTIFTPWQNEGYCHHKSLHIAEGLRRSYNGSGSFIY